MNTSALLAPWAVDDINELLRPQPLRLEMGLTRSTDGLLTVAIRTDLHGCKGRMLDWWFTFFETTQHIKWWHPHDHVEHRGWDHHWKKGERYVGASIDAVEWLAELPPVAARLKFHPAEEVFAPQSLHEARETQALSAAICARIGFGEFQDMERAGVDPSRWEDYKPGRPDPFGRREVWLGYDPSRTRDNATLVVVAPPMVAGERFRVLEKHYWRGLNFQYQAQEIERIAKKFRVTYLGVDVSGIGAGVYDLLKPTFKGVCHPINYSIESKSRLVLKMIDVVEANRIEWDSADRDIPLAFLAIKRSTTGGGQMTFRAARDNVTGHADVFFAIAHAVANEPLDPTRKRKSTWATSQERKAA